MTKKKTSSQKHAELKRLSSDAKKNLFEMLRLTQEILDDKPYVDKFGGESQLIEVIEAEEFSHFGGSPSLPEMLRAFRANPDEATWKEYHYSLRAMVELAEPAREAGERVHTNWKKLAKELEEKLAATEAMLKDYKRQTHELRDEVDELRAAKSRLEGKIEGLSLQSV